jgi:hypothetical protein
MLRSSSHAGLTLSAQTRLQELNLDGLPNGESNFISELPRTIGMHKLFQEEA